MTDARDGRMGAGATASDLEREYAAIRTGVGISTVDDLAKLVVRGDGAAELLDRFVAGNVARLIENSIRWTAVLDERGRLVADVQLYNDFGEYLITCDADAGGVVLDLLRGDAPGDVEIEDHTDRLAAVAVEGPDSLDLPAAVAGPDAAGLSLLRFTRCTIGGDDVTVARIGFTGEFGYLFFVPRERAGEIVARLRDAAPAAVVGGRSAHDLLRLEMRSFNRKLDLVRDETALEAGLHWMIDFRKPEFRGRDAVAAEIAAGLRRRSIGFIAAEPLSLAREAPVSHEGTTVGYVANAGWSPSLERAIGLAYLDERFAWVGLPYEVETDAGPRTIETASAPFLLTESTKRAAR